LSNIKDEQMQLEVYKKNPTREQIRNTVFIANENRKSRNEFKPKDEPKISPAKKETQLYAMIKKSSKHYSQQSYHTKDGKPVPFEVTIPVRKAGDRFGEVSGGVGGNYHLEELNIYVMINNEFVRLG
ncbi:MAG: hypothetical protein PF437_04210, partial [Sulfurimonas sp.]|nr:hypothetical protein [Sulfurimonas sp.]